MTTKKAKRGRPRVENPKKPLLQVRMTPGRYKQFATWCEASGRTVTEVITGYVDLCLGPEKNDS